jgi:hypothetical protein
VLSRGVRNPAATFTATVQPHKQCLSPRLRLEHRPCSTSSTIKMSLFGGDGTASRSQSPYDVETEHSQSPSSARSSPTIERRASPPSAQILTNARSLPDPLDDDDNDDEDALADGESDGHESDEDVATRSNRFRGKPHVWKDYTAADRQVATSLEQMQNSDLAAHLYNAHALKRRVRRPAEELAGVRHWQNNEQWLKKGGALEYTDVSGETQTNLVPSKEWTAWPLPPARIPRPYKDSAALRSGRDDWSIGRASAPDVGDDLREELLATFLRQAKERWSARETAHAPSREDPRATQSRSRSRSKSVKSTKSRRSASRGDVEMGDADDLQTDGAETHDEDEDKFGHIIGKKPSGMAQPHVFLRPIFLADDEKARRILQPTINSTLNKLDDLALAVRRTRLNHFGRKDYGDRSSCDFTSGAESSRPTSRQSDRPASRAKFTQPPPATTPSDGHPESDDGSEPETTALVSPSKKRGGSASKKRSRSASTASEHSLSSTRDDKWRTGLMDWSEVLALAAVKGWDERVLARTAQRCATLFGESMSFIPLPPDLATKPNPEPVQYIPSTIPAPSILPVNPPKRPLFRTGTLRCPHVDCYGYEKDFQTAHRVVEHVKRVHEYDPRTNDSDNEDRTFGGVHIDGYMQPIAYQRGWMERGKSRAGSEKKRQKTEGRDNRSAGEEIGVDSSVDSDSE